MGFDTSPTVRFRSSSRSTPDALIGTPFPCRSPRTAVNGRSAQWFETTPRRAAPEGQPTSITRTAPLPARPRHLDPDPAFHVRVHKLHPHYRGFPTTTGWSASVPRDGTQSLTVSAAWDTPSRSPSKVSCVKARLLPFHAEAADQACVVYMPDTTWPVSGHPPDSSRNTPHAPVSMSPVPVTTLHQRFAYARLPDPYLTPHTAPFPHRCRVAEGSFTPPPPQIRT
jgi:hypothetical protein